MTVYIVLKTFVDSNIYLNLKPSSKIEEFNAIYFQIVSLRTHKEKCAYMDYYFEDYIILYELILIIMLYLD